MSDQPVIEPVKNGWHALSHDLNLAVFGVTPEEAAAKFEQAVAKDAEIRRGTRPEHFANPS